MGTLTNLNGITEPQIPAAIARDAEVASAIASHVAASDPHPSLWTRIQNAFLALTGGQRILKNNPAMSAISYDATQNHLELLTNNGSNPIIGFHRVNFSATALYHLGYGNDSLRIRNGDGYDGALLHEGNHIAAPNPHPQYPTFKRKVYSGNIPATVNGMITIPHGLTANTIISFNAFATVYLGTISEIRIQPGGGVPPWVGQQFYYSVEIDPTNITVRTSANSSVVVNAPLTIVIDHV